MQPQTNIIQLHTFEVTAMLHGSGAVRVRYENGNLIIPVGSPEEAFAFIHRLAPPKSEPVPVSEGPLDHIDRTVNNLRKLADQLDGTESPEVREVVEGAVALASSKLHEKNGHTNGVGTVHAPVKPDLPVESVRSPEPAAPAEEPKTGVRAKADKKPKADKKAPTRTVADDVAAEETKAAAAAPEETAAASKEPEASPPAPEEEATGGDTASETSDLDEAYIASAPKMRDIVVHLYEKGLRSVDAILGELNTRKDHPLISKAVVTEDRIVRMLDAVGIDVSAPAGA